MGTRLPAGLLAVLLLAASFCRSDAESKTGTSVFASGKSKCIDCEVKNVKPQLAYQGLQVAIKCKAGGEGGYEIKSSGKLDRNGEYSVELPAELVGADGELRRECFAQLHSVSNAPCPDNNGLNPSKLVLKSKREGVHTLSTAARLPFSSATCASAFFWPPLNFPPLPKWHPFYKPFPNFPPLPKYGPPKPYYSPPSYKPPAPVYKPPTPVPKPPAPVKKPCRPPVPVVKPLPPPVPIVKPLPPPVPVKKPCPPVPIYQPPPPKFPPIYLKHLPKFPPIYKKPYHDVPKYPPTHA